MLQCKFLLRSQNAKMITLYILEKTLVILLGLTTFEIQVLSTAEAISEFSVCLGNTLAKKLPKTQHKPLHITSAMASAYLGILPMAMI